MGLGEVSGDVGVGAVIDGKYELTRLLGDGGIGAVFEATVAGTEQRVAVKCIHPRLVTNKNVVTQVVREAQTAGKLGAEHIVGIIDIGETAGAPYLVMDFLEGENLDEVVKREGLLQPDRAAALVLQLCRGLIEAHEKGIVHRDLKPENLFITFRDDGTEVLTILDFGIARFRHWLRLEAGADYEAASLPDYVAPELIREGKGADHRADVYSAGVILYELLTGEVPYRAESFDDLIVLLATTNPQPPRKLRPELSEELEQVVLRATARDVAGRFQNITEMATALAPIAGEAAGAPAPPPRVEPAPPPRVEPAPPPRVDSAPPPRVVPPPPGASDPDARAAVAPLSEPKPPPRADSQPAPAPSMGDLPFPEPDGGGGDLPFPEPNAPSQAPVASQPAAPAAPATPEPAEAKGGELPFPEPDGGGGDLPFPEPDAPALSPVPSTLSAPAAPPAPAPAAAAAAAAAEEQNGGDLPFPEPDAPALSPVPSTPSAPAILPDEGGSEGSGAAAFPESLPDVAPVVSVAPGPAEKTEREEELVEKKKRGWLIPVVVICILLLVGIIGGAYVFVIGIGSDSGGGGQAQTDAGAGPVNTVKAGGPVTPQPPVAPTPPVKQPPPQDSKNRWVRIYAPVAAAIGVATDTVAERVRGFRPARGFMTPTHAYEIQQHEVSWGELRPWLAANSTHQAEPPEWLPETASEQYPATNVPWATAAAYCKSLGGALPTEAEWELAARGAKRRPYAWGNAAPDMERIHAYREGQPLSKIMSAAQDVTPGPREEAIFDLMGNALEWTLDPYREDGPGSDARAVEREGMTFRAIRGLPPAAGRPSRFPEEGAAHRGVLCAGSQCSSATSEMRQYVGFRCTRPAAAPRPPPPPPTVAPDATPRQPVKTKRPPRRPRNPRGPIERNPYG